MAAAGGGTERARVAARQGRWGEAYDLLGTLNRTELSAGDLELLADAAWWRCRVEEEISIRQEAFARFAAAGEHRRAAYAAWLLSVRHGLRGQPTVASGWLKRAQRQLAGEPGCAEHGYVACKDAEQALARGRPEEAEALAARAVLIGQRCGDSNLEVLAISWQGLSLIARGEVDEGTALLDEAMTAVVAGELTPHFTGWVYCFVIGTCMAVADLRRAGRWAQAAWDWCSSLPEATPYHGLCRVRQVEVMSLRGEFEVAEAEARLACEEMLAFEPHLAGEAFYVTGEILRRKGDLAAAEETFKRALELGYDPQPGMARIRLAQGKVAAAEASLRSAMTDLGRPPFQRASLLAAHVEVALRAGRREVAQAASLQLDEIAERIGSAAIAAAAATARGRLLLAGNDAVAALSELRAALASWRELGLCWEAADVRALVGQAERMLGDREGAELELQAAYREFERLGAHAEAQRVARLLGESAELPAGLTARECEVLRLVAAGCTNRQIAEQLVLSEHTVARHLSNIFGKLDVSSRTAAAAFAFEHGLA